MTLAAVLLLGRAPALARWASQHELVFLRYVGRTRHDVRRNLEAPILLLLEHGQRDLAGALAACARARRALRGCGSRRRAARLADELERRAERLRRRMGAAR